MIDQCEDLEQFARKAAELAIQRCARGLLTIDTVAEHIIEEWNAQATGTEEPSQSLLNRLALRYCSSKLYFFCLDPATCNRAFENLFSYLKQVLEGSKYAQSLMCYANALDDILQQTLMDLHHLFSKQPPGGPDDPAAFLKWAQTILLHNAIGFLERMKREAAISLDEMSEEYVEQNAVCERQDILEQIIVKELQLTLKNAILSLKNPRYRLVLIALFLAGMEEDELAVYMGIEVKDIYLWRHRALKTLRSNREVIDTLRRWLR